MINTGHHFSCFLVFLFAQKICGSVFFKNEEKQEELEDKSHHREPKHDIIDYSPAFCVITEQVFGQEQKYCVGGNNA